MKLILATLGATLFGVVLSGPALALTVPFTESFTSNDAGWQGILSGQAVTHQATGGVANGGFIEITPGNGLAATSLAGNGSIVFRAAPAASGGAFAGNWLTGGVAEVQAYVRHDLAASPLDFYVRVTNGPAAIFFGDQAVPASNDWTLVKFAITPANFTTGGGTFNGVLAGVQNFMIGARMTTTPPLDTTVLFDIDQVSIATPEPSCLVLAALASLGSLAWRRRRR